MTKEMIIKKINLMDISPRTKGALKKLTLYQNPESRMYNVLTEWWDDTYLNNLVAIIAYINGKIVGWASDEGGTRHNKHIISCFVRPEYRRQGIGTELACFLIGRKKYAYVIAGDLISGAFWNYIQKNKKKHLNINFW